MEKYFDIKKPEDKKPKKKVPKKDIDLKGLEEDEVIEVGKT